jgi:autotransporter-associated beta strand protein
MRKKEFGFALFAACTAAYARIASADIPNQGNWQMLFADEFNGNTLDTVKWNTAYPWGRTHNYPAYIDDNNITVGNGTLNLQAKRQSEGGQPFTSGAVNTNGKLNFHTGYIEASMKLPSFLGAWPAFWALQDGWPPELDVMEARFRSSYNGNTNTYDGYGDMYSYIGTYHWGADYTVAKAADTGFRYPGGNLTSAFHRYGTLWASDHVEFFFDGATQGSVYSNPANIAQMQNMYLLLNLGVGGWPGDPPSWADLSPQFQIDWVRVWQQPGSANMRSNFKHNGNGNQNWEVDANWDNLAPKLGTQEAFFGNQDAATTDVRLDWNGNKVVGAITLQSSINYTIGWANDSLELINKGGRAYINGYYQSGQGKMAIDSRLELYNNTSVRNYLNQAINLDGDIIGPGELSIENGKTVITGQGFYTGATVVTNGGDLTVTNKINNTSNLFVQNGVATIGPTGSVTSSAYASIGRLAGDIGTLNVQGGLTASADLNVGDVNSTGSLNISGTSVVKAMTLYVGKFGTARGTVTQNGGSLMSLPGSGEWRIGGGGSSADQGTVGTYNLLAGTVSDSGNLQVGAYGRGDLVQTGGSVKVDGWLSIGRYAGSVGTYNMTSGNGILTAIGQPSLIVGEQGTGSLIIGGSSIVTANRIDIGSSSGAAGQVTEIGGTVNATAGIMIAIGGNTTGNFNLVGGTLNTTTISRGVGTGSFTFNGGTLRALTNTATFLQGLTTSTVGNGGANIDSNGFDVTISQNLTSGGSGGLTKLGAGSLTLAGSNSFSGGTAINGGTLIVSNDANLGAANTTLTLGDGTWQTTDTFSTPRPITLNAASSTIDVGSNTTLTLVGAFSGAGTLNKSGGLGSLVLAPTSGASTLAALNVSAGIAAIGNGTTPTTLTVAGLGTINSGGTLQFAQTAARVTNSIDTLAITGSGVLDVNNHNLLTNTPAATIRQYLINGYNADGSGNARWNGTGGISSSLAAKNLSILSVGYATSADNANTHLGLVGNQVLVKPTIPGDATLDGQVDIGDLNVVLSNYLSGKPGTWGTGDFTYAGRTDITDLNIVLSNYLGNSPLPSTSSNARRLTSTGPSTPVAAGTLEVAVDPSTGDVKLIGSQAKIVSMELASVSHSLVPANWSDLHSHGYSNWSAVVAESQGLVEYDTAFTANHDFATIDGVIDYGNIFLLTGAHDLVFRYGIVNSGDKKITTVTGNVVYTPEPTSLSWLGLGALGLLKRRIRRAKGN